MKDYRKILFPYAYNILGSSEDAKDAVQEVLCNFISSPRKGIENEQGYLIKSVINQSINVKNKQRKIHYEDDVWLPEPIGTEEADTNINLRDIVSYSLLILLEQLNPKERAVFILKEGFGYSHEEISEVLSSTVEHSRKLLSRAKHKLNQSREPARDENDETTLRGFLDTYISAIRARDMKALESLLSQDITFFADGGEKVKVVKKICTGVHDVADLLVLVYHQFQVNLSVKVTRVNHQPALLYYDGSRLQTCQVFNISEGKIQQISAVIDPGKLKGIHSA